MPVEMVDSRTELKDTVTVIMIIANQLNEIRNNKDSQFRDIYPFLIDIVKRYMKKIPDDYRVMCAVTFKIDDIINPE